MMGAGYGYKRAKNSVDSAFNRRADWKFVFSFLPRKCEYTNQSLWLKYAYRGRAIWTGPGDDVIEDKWCDKDEFLILRLKGIV